MKPYLVFVVLLAMPAALHAQAQAFEAPVAATVLADESLPEGTYGLVVGPAGNGPPAIENVQGVLTRTSWRIDRPGITTNQVMGRIRDQLLEKGYAPLFSCVADACGGFDFRFALSGFRAPDMFVDLGDFAYLAARGPLEERVAVLASRSNSAGYLEMTTIADEAPVIAPAVLSGPSAVSPGSLAEQLTNFGHVVLEELTFGRGAATLDAASVAALSDLADYIRARPEMRFALVGHTDSEGPLYANIMLSKARAEAVLAELIDVYQVPQAQLSAEGMGYLAPRANNLSPEGRRLNRRVEAIIVSTD